MGCLYDNVMASVMIKTVKHEAWQALNFPVLQTLLSKIVEILCKQKRFGFLKNCDDLYHNFWFLVKKKTAGNYWKINVITELNKIIKKDVNLLPSVNVFSEEFAEMHCTSLVDMFFEYDQILLNFCSCDLTAIQISISFLRRT